MVARTLAKLLSGTGARRADAQVIECRVDAGQPFASSRGRSFQVRIAAWKDAEGTAHPDPIVLKRKTLLPPLASIWAASMPAGSLCRVAIGPIEKRPYFYPTAPLLGFVGNGMDSELAAASLPLVKPQTFVDPGLGTFISRAEFPRDFEGEIDWHGRQITASIQRGADFSEGTLQRQASRLRELRTEAADVLERGKSKAAEELYPVWRENGWQGDDPILEVDDWKSRLQLVSVDLDEEGSFNLVFEDGDLFAGHDIILHADKTGVFTDATLFG